MLDLMWAFYWIDVLSSITIVFTFTSLLVLVIGVFCCLPLEDMSDTDASLYLKKVTKVLISVWVGLFLLFSFTPSKQTMYIMLGLYSGDKIINSETGKKLASIVEHELDSALAKYVKKESK